MHCAVRIENETTDMRGSLLLSGFLLKSIPAEAAMLGSKVLRYSRRILQEHACALRYYHGEKIVRILQVHEIVLTSELLDQHGRG